MARPLRVVAFLVVCLAAPLSGCLGIGSPNQAVFPEGDAAHTPPPAVNLPPADAGLANR